nr:cation:proton antiporter [Halovenus salina]
MSDTLLITVVGILAFGIAGQLLANRLRIPSVVFYIAGGLFLGEAGIGVVTLETFGGANGGGLTTIVGVSVAIIVFDGAFALQFKRIREASSASLRLVTVGALLMFAGTAAAVHWFIGAEWPLAFLIGALLVATGPTVITPIVNVVYLREHVSAALETEGIVNDVTAAVAAVVIFETILLQVQGIPVTAQAFGARIGVGVLTGFAIAVVVYYLQNEAFVQVEGVQAARFLTLLGAAGSYGVADFIFAEAGVVAAATAGITLGNLDLPHRESIEEFTEDVTMLLLAFVFVSLAALVDLEAVQSLGVGGIGVLFVVMVVLRPVVALLSTVGIERFTWPERGFLAAVGPRGIIPASVATLFAVDLENEAKQLQQEATEVSGTEAAELTAEAASLDNQAQILLGTVFLVIIATDVIEAGFARQIGDILGVTPMRTIIVGGGRVGRSLATQLENRDEFVIIVEDDEKQCRLSREAGFRVFEGDATNQETFEAAGVEDAKAVVAATDSDDINLLVCQTVKTKYNIDKVFARVNDPDNVNAFDSLGVSAVDSAQATAYALENQIERPAMAHWMNDLGDGHDIIEIEVTSDELSGKSIQEVNDEIPGGCLIAEMGRGSDAHVPDPDEIIEYGDHLTFLGEDKSVKEAIKRFHPHD